MTLGDSLARAMELNLSSVVVLKLLCFEGLGYFFFLIVFNVFRCSGRFSGFSGVQGLGFRAFRV